MLKRAGLAHRQHIEQTQFGILFTWNYLRLSFPLRRPSISLRCLPSAALATRPRTFRSSLSGIHISDAVPAVPAAPVDHIQDASKQVQGTETPQPARLLSTLLSRRLSKSRLREEILANPYLSEHLLDNTKARLLAESIASTPDFILAIKVLRLAHVLGCQLKQNAYECTAYHLARNLRWTAVLSVVSLGKRHTGKTTIRLLNWRIRALVEIGQHTILRDILKEFEQFQVKPNRRTFHLLLTGHVRNRDLFGARKLLRFMGQIGLPPDNSTHAIITTNYRNLGPNAQVQDQALKSLTLLKESTAVAVLNHLIQLRLDAQDPAAALQMLSVLDPNQVECITKAMSGVVSTPHDGNPYAEPLDEIYRTHHLSANAETFATFIHYMASRRDLPSALAIVEGLISTDIVPTPEIITALANVYFATGNPTAAFRTLLDLCEHRPAEAFESLSSNGLYDAKVPLPFVPSGIAPTTRMFNALLKGCIASHGLACVRDLFTIMQANGIRPNEATVGVLIASSGKYQRDILGFQRLRPRPLLWFLRKTSFPGLRPTLRHLHVLLSSVIRHERYLTFGGGWKTAAAMFSRTRQARPPSQPKIPHTEIFDPVGGIPLNGVYRTAQPFVDQLRARRTNVDGVVIALRLQREAAVMVDTDAAQDVFDVLLSRGIQPNEYHFSALMEGYTRKGDLPGALDILTAAQRMGVKPNRVMYTILIVGYGRQGQPEEALKTFQKMVEADVQPDVASIDAVAGAFFAARAYPMARRSLITLWPYVRPFPDELESVPLKDLATRFRLLQKDGQSDPKLSKSQWRKLYRQLRQLIIAWNAFKLSNRNSLKLL